MISKTFKIGEYAIGGIIKVNINESITQIQALDFFTKKMITYADFEKGNLYDIDEYLHELTSHYYADKIINYIKTIL